MQKPPPAKSQRRLFILDQDLGENMQITGADIIIQYLEEIGIETIFGIPGRGKLPLYDRLAKK